MQADFSPQVPAAPRRPAPHQFIDRDSGAVRTETLIADRLVHRLYHPLREHAPWLFRQLVSARASKLLGMAHFDLQRPLSPRAVGVAARKMGIDLTECLDPPEVLNSPRRLFERRIRYWECRPMPKRAGAVLSPSDARVLVGGASGEAPFFLKEKFFSLPELLGGGGGRWVGAFKGGDWVVLRLTPEKYHYNHAPVSGLVLEIYGVGGCYHSCNPGAVIALGTPYSKNRRVVTILDTDRPGGTGVGRVAMIEVAALMIGEIRQCYSASEYRQPREVTAGQFLEAGRPKSLFRPGSSVVVLLFEPGRVAFCPDLVANRSHSWAQSRYSEGLGRKLVETDIKVRSLVAVAIDGAPKRGR